MKGVVFHGDRKLELADFPDPTPGPGQVVLEIKASGMCGSDLHFYRAAPGEMQRKLGLGDVSQPNIAGHEPCGVVVERGPGVSDGEAPLGVRAEPAAEAQSEPGESGRPEGRHFRHRRPQHRKAQEVGLGLHQQIVA